MLSAEWVTQAAHPIMNHFLTAGERGDVRATCHNTASGVFGNIIQIQFVSAASDSDIVLHVVGCLGFEPARWNLLCVHRSDKVTLIAGVFEQRCNS